jgi:L-lactate dehydrogenase complex protein LldE
MGMPKPANRPKVALFATCLVDFLRPSVGFAAAKLLEKAGCLVEVPETPAKLRPLSKSYNGAESERLRKLKAFKNERN